MYLNRGQLYHVPPEASEDALFTVLPSPPEDRPCDFPRGGHNYYNGRDHERFFRRTEWLFQAKFPEEGWKDRYRKFFAKNQR